MGGRPICHERFSTGASFRGCCFFVSRDMKLLELAIAEFGRHMEVERNLSDKTTKCYLSDLRQYKDFLEKRES